VHEEMPTLTAGGTEPAG